jgi:hypothetical protein
MQRRQSKCYSHSVVVEERRGEERRGDSWGESEFSSLFSLEVRGREKTYI